MIAASAAMAAVRFLVGYLVMESVTLPGVELSARAGFPVGGVFLGLTILILGEIFRRGVSLQEDQDLTV